MRTYREMRPTFPNRADWTLPHVLRDRARTYGEKLYLSTPSTGQTFTYAETLGIAEHVASGLLAAGGQPGERVLIMAPNCAEYIFAWFGSSLAGLVEVPINNAYRGSFLEHQARTTRPTFAVIDASFANRFVESAEHCRSIQRFYLVGSPGEREQATRELEQAGWSVEPFERLLESPVSPLPSVRSRDLASVFFTSGTTGPSKGVMMPQSQMYFFAEECVSLTRLSDADTFLITGPLFHGNAQFLGAYPALIAGATFVLHDRFSASNWIDWMRNSRATVTNFVGVMMDFVWKQPPRSDDRDNQLRCVFAAPTAHSILEAFKERFGIEAFVEVFGLTETSAPIMAPYGEPRPAGAAGLLNADWFEIQLVDPQTDEEVPIGQVGELVVRTRQPWTCSMGYYGMPEKTVEAWQNLWFHTGDGLRRDADGWYYFVDRLKDALRRRGENISSYEVEAAILEQPGIAECAVVAVPAESEAGEDEVMLFAVAMAGSRLTAEEVWEWCDRRLPYFAVPRYVRFLDELPMTPSSKVQKAQLRHLGVDGETADRLQRQPRAQQNRR